MNVLYLINYAGKSGIEKYVENLVRLLSPEGVNCFFAYNVHGPLADKMAAAGVESIRLSLEWKDALSAAKKLAAFCREKKIDVIHAQAPRENVIAVMVKRRIPSIRVVYTSHFTTPCGKAWRLINRRFTKDDDCVIAVCNQSKDVLISNGCRPEKIRVIFNGVEPAPPVPYSDNLRKELGLSEDTFLMTTLARFDPEKGLDFLVKVMAALRKKTALPFCCAIAGDGPLMDNIRALVSAEGLENEVRILGYRTDAPDILAGSRLYLCTSSCNEALSFAILEAMNAGLPSVVTDVGGNRDLAETGIICGKVFSFGDTDGFSDAILELMTDEAERSALASAARRKVAENFDLNKLALDVRNTYIS